jgi:RimJ/RimL family protein N-acetyltransferase
MLRYGLALFRVGGARAFFPQLVRQIYSRGVLLGLEKDLNVDGVRVASRLPFLLRPATEKDIEELMVKAKMESPASVHELMERKWFYESGFRDCYAARTAATGELCFVAWLVSAGDGRVIDRGFSSRLPRMAENEVLLENCYTFEKYRGNNVMPAALCDIWEIARKRGFQRLITYVRRENAASLRSFEKLKLKQYEEITELKLMFFTRRSRN